MPLRLLLPFLAITALAQEFPVTPYTDPAQLDCPWPMTSHYKQPWRGYIETKSGRDFLDGLGVNLHLPQGSDELAIRLLAEAGFRRARMEVGWGEANWDETALQNERTIRRRFQLLSKHKIKPTILINAQQAAPCPMRFFTRRLTADAPKGATKITLDDVSDLVLERSGLNSLSEDWAAEVLITGIDEGTREVTLSKPLPKELATGEVQMATLKYAPLFPIGTEEFDETAAGFAAHALRVCRLARECGVEEFELEIWNELTSGAHFLNVNDYFDPAAPRAPEPQRDFLKPAGRGWELAKRVLDGVRGEFPDLRVLWGFSNTSFFHTPISQLPPGISGQSYHPFGTGTRKIARGTAPKDQPSQEGFVPTYELRMPEGWAHTFVQTESLIRHLNPIERLTKRPPGTPRFFHYVTEHGVLPTDCDVSTAPEAWRLKSLCATRSFLLWLNKGIDVLHYSNAYEADPMSAGLLPVNLQELPADAKFTDVATPPMRALNKLVRQFSGSEQLEETTPLQIDVTALGEQTVVFAGDAGNPPLWHREVLAALPFQITAQKHVIAVYVMTRDVTKPFTPQNFRLKITGAKGGKVACYDAHENRAITVETRELPDALEVTLPVGQTPQLLTIEP